MPKGQGLRGEVVAIWGHFEAGETWDRTVAYVDGDRLADWIAKRPADLRDERKRAAVRDWLLSQPHA